jgi:hypothetical protein
VIRVASNAFELEPAQVGAFNMHLYRNTERDPMQLGERITTQPVSIEVLEVNNGAPLRIRISSERSLDDPTLFFAARYQGRLVHFSLPPVGGVMILL